MPDHGPDPTKTSTPARTVPDAANAPRVGLYHGKGANISVFEPFFRQRGVPLTVVGPNDLGDLAGRGIDVLYLPGGWYQFTPAVNAAIAGFVEAGGGCIGTCAGSYLVAGHLGLIPGEVLRPGMRGRAYLEPQQGEHAILRGAVRRCRRHNDRKWEPIAMAHMGGPFILPKDSRAIIASYDFEGRIGAIVAADRGRGRAVAIASHPEHPTPALPATDDSDPNDRYRQLQGDESLIPLNAIYWAAHREDAIPWKGADDE